MLGSGRLCHMRWFFCYARKRLCWGKQHSTCSAHIIKNNLSSSPGRGFKVDLPARLLSVHRYRIYILYISIRHICTHLQADLQRDIALIYKEAFTELTSHCSPLKFFIRKAVHTSKEVAREGSSNAPCLVNIGGGELEGEGSALYCSGLGPLPKAVGLD